MGIIGYYRKFVKNNGKIVAPLTTLAKEDAFTWSEVATLPFNKINEVMCSTPLLATPNFSKPSMIDCDGFKNGIGVVLMQHGHS